MSFNKKDHFNPGEIRPRFKLQTSLTVAEVIDLLQEYVDQDDSVLGRDVDSVYYLDIPLGQRHFWSPELRVTAEKDEYADHDDTIIRVMVGPQYTVWALFVFLYTLFGVICLFGGMYGLSKLTLGQESIWVWCAPIMLALILGVYVISKSGQKAARDETLHLVSCLYHALGLDNVERIES